MALDTKLQFEAKSPIEMMQISYASSILSKYLQSLPERLPRGLKEIDIEHHAVKYLSSNHANPSSKGYNGFPSDISISKNHVVAHGIPSEKFLQDNDIITVDIVSEYSGWFADLSWTYGVGNIDEESKFLLRAAWKITSAAIKVAKLGNTLQDIGYVVDELADKIGVYVYKEFVGHGIGKEIHEPPFIVYNKHVPPQPIKTGMVLCIEPIVSIKKQRVKKLPNGAYVGMKNEKTAVFEHMLGVFEKEVKVLSYHMMTLSNFPEEHPHFQ